MVRSKSREGGERGRRRRRGREREKETSNSYDLVQTVAVRLEDVVLGSL